MSALLKLFGQEAVSTSSVFGGGGPSLFEAIVIPFPASRRHCDIAPIAARMLTISHERAERYLADLTIEYADHLADKWIEPHLINAEIASFHGAVRAELWRLVLGGPRA